jgi:hypothetical protein
VFTAKPSVKVKCRCCQLENGIYELRFFETSNEAVDEWAAHVDRIIRENSSTSPIRLLVKANGSKTQPVAHLFLRMRELSIRHPQRPSLRVVVLHGPDYLSKLVGSMFNALRTKTDYIRFFTFEDEQAAVEWLLDR